MTWLTGLTDRHLTFGALGAIVLGTLIALAIAKWEERRRR